MRQRSAIFISRWWFSKYLASASEIYYHFADISITATLSDRVDDWYLITTEHVNNDTLITVATLIFDAMYALFATQVLIPLTLHFEMGKNVLYCSAS
jgi:hypothetical protein